MKKTTIKLILVAILVTFCACKKLTTVKIPVSSMNVELNDIRVQKNAAKNDDLNFFNETKIFYLEDIQGITSDAIKYKKKIESIEAGAASITLVSTDNEEYIIKDFVLQAFNVGTINIAQYNLGTPYTDNVQSFAIGVIMRMFTHNSVTFNVSGKTDLPSGENLKVKITLEDITIFAGLLK